MGFFSRLGNKIVGGIQSASRLGKKALGTIHRSGIGLVKNVSALAGTGKDMIEDAEDIVRRGSQALQTGDVAGASDVLRRGKNLVGTSKNTLERAREVQREASKIASRSM